MTGPFRTELREGVVRVVLDLPGEPINKITRAVRDELDALLTRFAGDDAVRAVVLLSGKPDTFIAGADIDEFTRRATRAEARNLVKTGQTLINRLEELGKPVVAAIHGACLGGGLEAALACTYRIASDAPATKLGLPEVKLGIIPAAGGCQRLPRLIGIEAALDIILQGKVLPAAVAYRRGIVDDLVHPAILERVAVEAAKRLVQGWRPDRKRVGVKALVLEKNPLGRAVLFRVARKRVEENTGGHYPAPPAALEAVQHGMAHGVEAGLDMEAALFAELAVGDVSRELVRIFFATNALKKDLGVADPPEPRPVRSLGIVGAGFMGSGIGGTAVAQARVDVRFRDTELESVAAGLEAARRILDHRKRRRRIDPYEHRRLTALLSGGTGWEGFGRADLVVEAVFEDLDVKREVFRDLERVVGDECLLASNTSTIPIGRIAEAARRPERVLGMHFFSPVEKMPLLEVIVTDRTAPWATVTAVTFGRRMGKTVVVVQDQPGFWVNRILAPYMNEAGRLVVEGVEVERIDGLMEAFGFPMGPLTVLDQVGLDVGVKASRVLHEAYGERLAPVAGLERLVDEGRKGKKSGRGFYRYANGKKRGVDASVYTLLDRSTSRRIGDEEIEARLVYAMLNEAARALDDGVVRTARDGDIAAIFGIGYPPFRGGPLRYLDRLGVRSAVDTLKSLRDAHGDRFAPAPLLERLAEENARLYPDDAA